MKFQILHFLTIVSVENLLPNRKGKVNALVIPNISHVKGYHINDILLGNIRPYLQKIWFSNGYGYTNGDVLILRIRIAYKEIIIPRFLYCVIASEKFFLYDTQYSKGAKMPRGDKSMIMQYKIPIPPIEEQKRIVSILDQFDTLVNDISKGLPAEIEARRRQYEYYRDRLLTFKEIHHE